MRVQRGGQEGAGDGRLHAAKLTGLSEAAIYEALLQRERLGSTGIGEGIAIPHGKLPGLTHIFGLVARLEKPVDFEALDDQQVDVLFLLLAPEGAGADHLKALARVARVLREPGLIERVRATKDATARNIEASNTWAFFQAKNIRRHEIRLQISEFEVLLATQPDLPAPTRAMIDERRLGLMKKGAIFVNTSRGPVQQERALFEALAKGHLAAAGLDVFEEEPTSRDNPLLNLDNVVVSSHVAGVTVEAHRTASMQVTSEMLRVLRGERPHVLANPDVWPRVGIR